jgi:hypothetical protein
MSATGPETVGIVMSCGWRCRTRNDEDKSTDQASEL